MKITIFKDISQTRDPYHVDIEKVFNRIKTGIKSKALIEKIRIEADKKERDKLKLKLPCICFSGIFEWRANAGIKSHSGLVALDFDGMSQEELAEFRSKLMKNKYTYACFISPSNNGMKVIVKIPSNIKDHKAHVEALRLYYKQDHWDDLKDVARICYESYDPNIYINNDAMVFDMKVEVDPTNYKPKKPERIIKDFNEIYKNIVLWLEKHQQYSDGNKYVYLVALASACNRFGIEQYWAETRIIKDYQHKASPVDEQDFVDIVQRIYISYVNQFGTSWFEADGEINDFDPMGPVRDVIYVSEIEQDMWNSLKNGDARGETTYYPQIDLHWTWRKGEINLMGGIPNHGKSTMMLQLMLVKSFMAKKLGLPPVKWGIFSPEQNPPTDFYKDLIHSWAGKTTEKHHIEQFGWELISDEKFKEGIDFMNEHFFFVYPKDEAPTPTYINSKFEELIIKHGVEGCMIDPFNQLDNDWGKHGRDDLYISSFLSAEKRFALDKNVYKITVAHPKGGLEKNATGNYTCPDVYNFAGGAMWNNKCDNILISHRPFYTTNKGDTSVEFSSKKIKKQKLVGIPGTAMLDFNRKTNRYEVAFEDDVYDETNLDENGNPMRTYKAPRYNPFDHDLYDIKKQYSNNRIVGESTGNSADAIQNIMSQQKAAANENNSE